LNFSNPGRDVSRPAIAAAVIEAITASTTKYHLEGYDGFKQDVLEFSGLKEANRFADLAKCRTSSGRLNQK